jgi:TrmH family RNA methyltransferase
MLSMKNITSMSNPICVHIKKLGTSKKYRDEHGEFLCDGLKLLDEAISTGVAINTVLCSMDLERELPVGVNVYKISKSMIDSLSPLKNAQNVLFTCRYIDQDDYDRHQGTYILLDNIQDPGNVGTIIRSANAFDIKSVILTDGCADIYNPKTIRASMGAVFKQHFQKMDLNTIIDFKNKGVKFVGASSETGSLDVRKTILTDVVIILGNEGQGISKELADLCDEMIWIPVSSNCESLNAAIAASILMWETKKENKFLA